MIEETLKEVFSELTRSVYLVVTMIIKRRLSKAFVEEAVQRLGSARDKLQSLVSIDRKEA